MGVLGRQGVTEAVLESFTGRSACRSHNVVVVVIGSGDIGCLGVISVVGVVVGVVVVGVVVGVVATESAGVGVTVAGVVDLVGAAAVG